MTERPRPYIPLSVRVQVAERQVNQKGSIFWPVYAAGVAAAETMGEPWSLSRRLRVLLTELEPDCKVQLDHDPALILRAFKRDRRKPVAAWYTPNANDPDYLLYRVDDNHLQKTTGRKPGAAKTITIKGSDIGIKTKFARLERKAAKGSTMRMTAQRKRKQKKQKIASRSFQKGRKFR